MLRKRNIKNHVNILKLLLMRQNLKCLLSATDYPVFALNILGKDVS